MGEGVLTTRELNRALLARQLLLDRPALPPDRALQAVCGLQTQHSPSGYLGLWSRTSGLRRVDLTAALHRAAVVQGWVMRSTIHMVAAADYAPFTEAVRTARRAQWLRAEKRAAGLDMAATAAAVRRHLADGPLPQPRLVALLAADFRKDETRFLGPNARPSPGLPKVAFAGAQLWVDLLRVPPAGTWEKPRATVYALAEQVLPAPPPVAEESARDLLVTRYLRAFGPASPGDVASFTGLPLTEVRAVLARCSLSRFRDEAGGELVDVPDGPLPDPATPAPVRFLGPWDAVLLVHARRTQLLPEVYRPRVFAVSMPRSVPTFLMDGRVAGTWRYAHGRVETTPFHDLPVAARRDLDGEGERLAAFHADPG
jgi:Winged helix DNA-binding domain